MGSHISLHSYTKTNQTREQEGEKEPSSDLPDTQDYRLFPQKKQLLEASRRMDWVGRIGKQQKQRQSKKQEEREREGIGVKEIDKRGTNQEMLSLHEEQQNQTESGKSTSTRQRKNRYKKRKTIHAFTTFPSIQKKLINKN